jgi:hypothetical protein
MELARIALQQGSRWAMRCDAMRCDAMRCDAMRCDACRSCRPMVGSKSSRSWNDGDWCTMYLRQQNNNRTGDVSRPTGCAATGTVRATALVAVVRAPRGREGGREGPHLKRDGQNEAEMGRRSWRTLKKILPIASYLKQKNPQAVKIDRKACRDRSAAECRSHTCAQP